MTFLQSLSFRLTAVPHEKRQILLTFAAAVSIFLPYYVSACVLVGIALYVLCGRQRRIRIVSMPYSKLIFAVIGVGCLVSLGYANYVGALVSVLIACALVTGLYLRSFMTRRLFNRILDVLCVGGLCVSVAAILQKLAGGADVRPFVVFDNPNFFATVMEMMVLIAVYRLMGNPRHSNFYFSAALLAAFGVYLSGSLSAFAVCVAGVALYLLLRGHTKTGVLIIVLAAGFVLLATEALPHLMMLLGSASNSDAAETAGKSASELLTVRSAENVGCSVSNRLSIWKTALLAIPDHLLFGQGPNTYAMIYSKYLGPAFSHAHNMILEMLLNYGIIGGGAIVFFAFQQVHAAMRKIREHKSTTTNLLLVVLCLMMLAHGMTDVTLVWPQTALMFLLVFSSSGIRTVPQARCFVLRAPDFAPNPEFKRNVM